eukprot:2646552-Prymnesium_polylepis.1
MQREPCEFTAPGYCMNTRSQRAARIAVHAPCLAVVPRTFALEARTVDAAQQQPEKHYGARTQYLKGWRPTSQTTTN